MAKPPPPAPKIVVEVAGDLDGKEYFLEGLGDQQEQDKKQVPVVILDFVRYDSATKKYVYDGSMRKFFKARNINDAALIDIETVVDTTSAASHEITVTTDEAWVIIGAWYENGNRNHYGSLTITPDGQTAVVLDGLTAVKLGGANVLVGGASPTSGGGANAEALFNKVPLAAGDKLKLTDATFQAGDTMKFYFIYAKFDVS
jgi:hypothetical protein